MQIKFEAPAMDVIVIFRLLSEKSNAVFILVHINVVFDVDVAVAVVVVVA